MSDIVIVGNDLGWEPNRPEVDAVLDEMKKNGFRTDWTYCLALKTRALMFSEHSDHEIVDSEIIYFHGKFLTEAEYYEEPLTHREHKWAVSK